MNFYIEFLCFVCCFIDVLNVSFTASLGEFYLPQMEISEKNLIAVSDYLSKTLNPDINIRRPAEQFLQSVEYNQNYPLLLIHVIDKPLDISVRVTASVTLKNFIKRNWPVGEDGEDKIHPDDRCAIKTYIVNLMLSSPELVQKQLSDAISIIGKYDFPDKWPNLLNELIEKIAPGDYHIMNGALHTAHSLFKKYRYEFKSQQLWTEIKFVLDTFAKPLTELFVHTMQVTETGISATDTVKVYHSLLLVSKIFHSLNYQDLPEFFEDNMALWMGHFHTLLTRDVPLLSQNTDTEESGLLEELRSQICESVTMYANKYDEEFSPFLPNFVTDIWNLLTSNSNSPKYDALVSNSLQFLATVAGRTQYQHLFEEPTVLSSICEKVIIPNMEFRTSDEELFEDNPEEYIRRDIEGSDVDTRRRAACDLVKVLSKRFESKIMTIFGSYVQVMLDRYSENSENWRSKDAALYLVTSLAARGQTQKFGVTQTSSLVNLKEFAVKHIIPELEKPNVNDVPVIKADSIKYIMSFRTVLEKEIIIRAFPSLVRCLEANSLVVHTYAASAIEKILLLKEPNAQNVPLIKSNDLGPLLKNLVDMLFIGLTKPGSEENEYIMRAIMRSFDTGQGNVVPLLTEILPKLLDKLGMVAKNPSKPNFNHYLFETIALSIKIVCKVAPEGVNAFETALFPIFQIILQQDIAEFMPYIFQLLAMLLEFHKRGEIPQPYTALYPFLLSAVLWERSGNVHPMVRLINAYLMKCEPSRIDAELKLVSLLGIFQKLISSRKNDHEGFCLMQYMMEHCPNEMMTPYLRQVFILLFQRLTSSKTTKFARGIILFFSYYAINFGASSLITMMDSVQPHIFGMVVEKVIIPDAQSINTELEKKTFTVGMAKLLTEAKELYDGSYSHLWAPLLRVLFMTFEVPEEITKEFDIYNEIYNEIDISYEVGYSRLVFAAQPVYDPLQGIGDSRVYLSNVLSTFSQSNPGKIAALSTGLTNIEKELLKKYVQN